MFRNRFSATALALLAVAALPVLAQETSLYMDSEP